MTFVGDAEPVLGSGPARAEPPGGRWPYPATLPRPSLRPFVGRVTEIASLRTAWERVAVGATATVLIGGEAGAGKTRLAAEFATERHAEGAIVVSGACDSDVSLPYQPWIMAVDQLVRLLPAPTLERLHDELSHLALLVPRIEQLVAGVDRTPSTEPETERERLLDAIRALLVAATKLTPVLLVLDDLHWAGPQTLAVLRRLARSTPVDRLMIVGTFRDTGDEVTEPLASVLADLRRVESAARIKLAGLDVDAVHALLTTMEPSGEWAELATTLTQRTGGNPFFVWELWNTESTRLGHGVPDGVMEVVAARLRRLSPAAREITPVLAVSSGRIELTVLREAVGGNTAGLAAALDELVRAGVVTELPGPIASYQYAHALLRDAVSESLPALTRSELHLAMAYAIERVYEADRRLMLAELTYHFAAAVAVGGREKAVYYGQRAATQARRTAAYDEAVAVLRLVLSLVADASSERASLLVDLGDLLARSGNVLEAATAAAEAYETATAADDLPLRARAATGFEQAAHVAHLPDATVQAMRMVREVLLACGTDDSPMRARVRGSLAHAKSLLGQPDAVDDMRAALAEARRTGDADALIATLEAATIVMTDPHEVLALASELDVATEASGDAWRGMWATANHIRVMFELGRLDEARRIFGRHRERAMAFHFPLFRFQSAVLESMLALADGRFDDAERAIEDADRIGSDDPTLPSSGVYGLQMFLIRREQNRLGEMAPTLQLVRSLGQRPAIWGPGLALAFAELDLHDDARQLLYNLAADDFGAVPRDSVWPVALSFLADTCVILADATHAAALLRALDRYAGRTLTTGFSACEGPADRLRAGLVELLGDHCRADELAADALALATRSGSPVWRAHAEEMAAWMQRRRGTEVGLPRDDAVIELPDGLTDREVEVLALVAVGLSNRDIATRLFISPNTTANHVRSILQKIGASNRTEAAAYAIRNRLVGA